MAKLYPHKHSGAALLVGYAPSVHADVEAARRLRPDAPLLGVKYSCVLSPEIEHVWTQHLEQANHIREQAGRRVFVHARKRVMQRRRGPVRTVTSTWFTAGDENDIDFVWPELIWVYGSSGFAGALWARHGMGFDEVILCGIPLEPGGYAPEVRKFKALQGEHGGSFVDTPVLLRWREGILNYVKDGRAAGIFSMSGWTRETLGRPC